MIVSLYIMAAATESVDVAVTVTFDQNLVAFLCKKKKKTGNFRLFGLERAFSLYTATHCSSPQRTDTHVVSAFAPIGSPKMLPTGSTGSI